MGKFQCLLLLQILAFLATSAIGQIPSNKVMFRSFPEMSMSKAKIFTKKEASDLLRKSWKVSEASDVKNDFCDRYDIDGCSVPFGWVAPYKAQFTPSCDRHDICYRCGISYKINQLECDEPFYYDMKQTCYSNLTETHTKMFESIMREKSISLNAIMTKSMNDMARESGDLLSVVLWSDMEEALRKKVVVEWLVFLGQFIKNEQVDNTNTKEVSQECAQLLEAADMISLPAHRYRVSQVVTCKQVKVVGCLAATYAYYRVVRMFGSNYYRTKPDFYCRERFVKMCLPKE